MRPGREVTSNGPIYGRAWFAGDAGAGLFIFDEPAGNQAEDGDLGIVAADRVCVSRVLLDVWADAVLSRGKRREQTARVCVCGIGIRVWRARQATVLDRIHFRVSGFADDYFYRVAVCAALLPGRHAGGDSSGGVGDAASDGRERGGIAERRGEHLHGADGSAADDPAVSSGLNAI